MPTDILPTPTVQSALSKADIESRMQAIREVIWKRRPILGDIMQRHGADRLYDYARDFMDIKKSPRLTARQPELIGVVRELLSARLGNEVANGVAEQLAHFPLVSTADHHSPIQHPFWVNSNIISALPYVDMNHDRLKYLIAFSFATVSLNNASGYPRGVLFHGKEKGEGPLLRIPIMPDREKMATVYSTRAFTRPELDKAKAEIAKKEREGEVAPGRAGKINELIEKYFGHPKVLSAPDISTQITHINYWLWKEVFHPAKDTAAEKKARPVPDLIYLEIETIVTELLLRFHLKNSASPLYKVLFDKTYSTLAKTHFNNIPGAFSAEKNWGTHFFWGLDEKRHRVRMFLNGSGTLHSENNEFGCLWTPEGVAEALRSKRIFPSMVLCYLMTSLYYGVKCLGGFSQVNDLTYTKGAWQKLLREAGDNEEADAVEHVQTKELGGDGMVLAYLEDAEHHITPGSSFDLILDDESTTYDKYLELAKRVSLSDMMASMLPEMYTVLYSQPERDPLLTEVTPEAIIAAVNLHDKIFDK